MIRERRFLDRVSASRILHHLGNDSRSFECKLLQWKIRSIEVQHFEQDVGKNQQCGDEVDCAPGFRGAAAIRIRQHWTTRTELNVGQIEQFALSTIILRKIMSSGIWRKRVLDNFLWSRPNSRRLK